MKNSFSPGKLFWSKALWWIRYTLSDMDVWYYFSLNLTILKPSMIYAHDLFVKETCINQNTTAIYD